MIYFLDRNMNPQTAIQGIATADEKVEKQTFQSTYYAEKQAVFEKARTEFVNNPDLIVEYLSAEIDFDTTKLQYNETGTFISTNNQELMSETFLGKKNLQIDNKIGAIAIEDTDKDQIRIYINLQLIFIRRIRREISLRSLLLT